MKVPARFTLTFTVTVHEPLAGMQAPVKVTLEASSVTVPPHVVLAGPETSMPLGNVSMSGAVSVSGVLSELCRGTVRVEFLPRTKVAGLKDLVSLGGPLEVTVKVAEAGVVLLPTPVCNAPAARELT